MLPDRNLISNVIAHKMLSDFQHQLKLLYYYDEAVAVTATEAVLLKAMATEAFLNDNTTFQFSKTT